MQVKQTCEELSCESTEAGQKDIIIDGQKGKQKGEGIVQVESFRHSWLGVVENLTVWIGIGVVVVDYYETANFG